MTGNAGDWDGGVVSPSDWLESFKQDVRFGLWRAVAIPMADRFVFRGPNRVAASHGSRQIQSSWSSTFALNTHCWGEPALFTPRGPSLYARHSKSMM